MNKFGYENDIDIRIDSPSIPSTLIERYKYITDWLVAIGYKRIQMRNLNQHRLFLIEITLSKILKAKRVTARISELTVSTRRIIKYV